MTEIITTIGIWIGIIAGLWTIFDPKNGLLSLIFRRKNRTDNKKISVLIENTRTNSKLKNSKKSKPYNKCFKINTDLAKVIICFVLSHIIVYLIIQRNFPSISNQFSLNPFSLELYTNIKTNYIPFVVSTDLRNSFDNIVIVPYFLSFCVFITMIVFSYIKEITNNDDASFIQIPGNIILGIFIVGLFSFNFPTVLLILIFIPLKLLDFFIFIKIRDIMNFLIPVFLFLTYYFPPLLVYWYKKSNDTGNMLI